MKKVVKYLKYLGTYLKARTVVKHSNTTESIYVQYDDYVKIRVSDHLPVLKTSTMTICPTNMDDMYMVFVTSSRKVLTFNYEGLKNFLRNTVLYMKTNAVSVCPLKEDAMEASASVEEKVASNDMEAIPSHVLGIHINHLNAQELTSIKKMVKGISKKPNAMLSETEASNTVLGYDISLFTRGQKIYINSTIKRIKKAKIGL